MFYRRYVVHIVLSGLKNRNDINHTLVMKRNIINVSFVFSKNGQKNNSLTHDNLLEKYSHIFLKSGRQKEISRWNYSFDKEICVTMGYLLIGLI